MTTWFLPLLKIFWTSSNIRKVPCGQFVSGLRTDLKMWLWLCPETLAISKNRLVKFEWRQSRLQNIEALWRTWAVLEEASLLFECQNTTKKNISHFEIKNRRHMCRLLIMQGGGIALLPSYFENRLNTAWCSVVLLDMQRWAKQQVQNIRLGIFHLIYPIILHFVC